MSDTVVFATPTSSWSSAAALAMRSRVSRWLSARAFNSYLRFSVDMLFIHVTVIRRFHQTLCSSKGSTHHEDHRVTKDRGPPGRQGRKPRLDRRPLHDRGP